MLAASKAGMTASRVAYSSGVPLSSLVNPGPDPNRAAVAFFSGVIFRGMSLLLAVSWAHGRI